MLNHITVMGRLTKDPELRYTQSGTAVCSFTVAVDRDYQSKDSGEKQTDFIDCVAWRTTGEFVSKYFSKGRMTVVDGSLQSRKWQDKNGNNRVSWEINVNSAYFGDSKKDGDGGYQQGAAQGYQAQSPQAAYPASNYGSGPQFSEVEDDGELPF